MKTSEGSDAVDRKARDIKLLFVDVDGVLTDGRIVLNGLGDEIKCFDVRDGLGIQMLVSQGIQVALITGRSSQVVERRAKELGISELHQGVRDKGAICRRIRRRMALRKRQTGAIGDDLPDMAMFRETGLRIAVCDAVAEVVDCADRVTVRPGGRGAVRETCEWILKCQGKWPDLMRKFQGESALQDEKAIGIITAGP